MNLFLFPIIKENVFEASSSDRHIEVWKWGDRFARVKPSSQYANQKEQGKVTSIEPIANYRLYQISALVKFMGAINRFEEVNFGFLAKESYECSGQG